MTDNGRAHTYDANAESVAVRLDFVKGVDDVFETSWRSDHCIPSYKYLEHHCPGNVPII